MKRKTLFLLLAFAAISAAQPDARLDTRGYSFLNKEKDLNDKLKHWNQLDDARQKQYSEWLVGECNNTVDNIEGCKAGLKEAILDEQVLDYHERYEPIAAEIYHQNGKVGF